MSKKEIFASGAMPSISPKTPKLFPATEPDTWVPWPSEVGGGRYDQGRGVTRKDTRNTGSDNIVLTIMTAKYRRKAWALSDLQFNQAKERHGKARQEKASVR